MRAWRPVPILLLALVAAGCGGDDPRPRARANETSSTAATAASSGAAATTPSAAADPAGRVDGWPAAFCRVRVGDSRPQAVARMGPPTETAVRPRGRRDVWEHYGVRLEASYTPDGAVRRLRDGSGDSRLPCAGRRAGDARLDAYATAYQRACNTVLRAQQTYDRESDHALAARSTKRADRLLDRAVARTIASYRGAARRMRSAEPPRAFARTQRRVDRVLPDDAGAKELVRRLRAGTTPEPKVGISLRNLRLPERLLVVAPNCDDIR